MDMKKIIRTIMLNRGFNGHSLAEKLNYSSASGLNNVIRRQGGMRVDNLIKIMDAMDYEVVVRSKLSDKSEWVIK